jgi:L-cystine uptake protein TcyP (sodium:dicarboxylate symporter family)
VDQQRPAAGRRYLYPPDQDDRDPDRDFLADRRHRRRWRREETGRIGLKTIIYFEVVTTIAIVVGLVLANLFHPGAGIDMSTLGTVDISKYQATAAEVQHEHAFIETILNLIPSNIFAA